MPYLGNIPAEQYVETASQVLTGDGTVGPYTLDYAVGNVGDIEVFVNNVRQQGGSSYAYTVSGDQLTMTGTVSSSDDFYVVFQRQAVGTITPPSNYPTTGKAIAMAMVFGG
jgi:sRNA-binding regulator protein Hfq